MESLLRMLAPSDTTCRVWRYMLHPQASKLASLALALPTHYKPTLHAPEAKMSTDSAIDEDHYATAANFGGDVYVPEDGRPPFVKRVTVPESIKRRVPSKHYVSVLVVHVYSCMCIDLRSWKTMLYSQSKVVAFARVLA